MNPQKALRVERRFDFGRLLLKILAIGTMTIDHIGAILFPGIVILRIVGRLAFPIFGYLLILGVESTRNVKKYFARLLVFAFISQIPYFFAFGLTPLDQLNIFFSLFFGGLFVYLVFRGSLLAVLPVLAAFFLNTEGNLYGIVFIFSLALLRKSTLLGVLAAFLLNLQFMFEWSIQAFSILSLIVIVLHKKGFFKIEKEVREKAFYFSWMKYGFYIYYPLHLMILYLIKVIFF
jgi:hypothetical protein